MKQTLLDTNFILTSIRNKIDFFEEIKFLGMQILIPKQVISEIERISESKKKLRFREESKIALKILKRNKFKKIDLKTNYVDKGIKKYSKEHSKTIIATLDRELKKSIPNQKLIIRGKKKLEVV